MLNVNLVIDKNLQILKELVVKGHAHFDIKGKDVVCASVSILVYSFLLSCKKIPGLSFYNDDKEGLLKITLLEFDKRVQGELHGITLMLINGLMLLNEQFKDHIKIEIKEKMLF